ncbi:hypothetical protein GA0115244_10901, partial [Streptomyces sp. DvalAA-19]
MENTSVRHASVQNTPAQEKETVRSCPFD